MPLNCHSVHQASTALKRCKVVCTYLTTTLYDTTPAICLQRLIDLAWWSRPSRGWRSNLLVEALALNDMISNWSVALNLNSHAKSRLYIIFPLTLATDQYQSILAPHRAIYPLGTASRRSPIGSLTSQGVISSLKKSTTINCFLDSLDSKHNLPPDSAVVVSWSRYPLHLNHAEQQQTTTRWKGVLSRDIATINRRSDQVFDQRTEEGEEGKSIFSWRH